MVKRLIAGWSMQRFIYMHLEFPVAACLVLNLVLVTVTLISLWKKGQASKQLREAQEIEDKWTEVVLFWKVSRQ